MFGSIAVLFVLPWLDRSPVKSIRYRGGIFKKALFFFVISFFALGYLGTQPATPTLTIFARVFTLIYFGFFLLMPIYTRWEKPKPVPRRLTKSFSMEGFVPEVKSVIEEMTIEDKGFVLFGSSEFKRKPNPEGIRNVLFRLAKKIKTSLE